MKMKKDDDAIGIFLGLLIVAGIIVIGAVVMSVVLGLFGFIGICLLLASAFILWKTQGKVDLKSPFFVLLAVGLVLVFSSTVLGLDILTEQFADFKYTVIGFLP